MQGEQTMSSTMPMLDVGGDMDYRISVYLHGWFTPFLIPSASRHYDKHLAATSRSFMNEPVVAASMY